MIFANRKIAEADPAGHRKAQAGRGCRTGRQVGFFGRLSVPFESAANLDDGDWKIWGQSERSPVSRYLDKQRNHMKDRTKRGNWNFTRGLFSAETTGAGPSSGNYNSRPTVSSLAVLLVDRTAFTRYLSPKGLVLGLPPPQATTRRAWICQE